MALDSQVTVSVVMATYGRHEVLAETVAALLALRRAPDELLVVDQTPSHPEEVKRRLEQWAAIGAIRHLRLDAPSIPGAMNAGLLAATGEVVLFLDDDLLPNGELIAGHERAQISWTGGIVAGQVLQPGEEPAPLAGAEFSFRSSLEAEPAEFMAGNVSVRRALALALGGFDENFVGAAYRFERDFARRALAAGASIRFAPAASIRHLRAPRGGTRSFGSHLTTIRPAHAVGEYYYLMRHRPAGALGALCARPWRSVMTRHHARRPWWIPATIVAELAGLAWALWLTASGPRLLAPVRQAEASAR